MTAMQVERFADACGHFQRLGAPMPLRHLANSGGVLHFPGTWLDMVRPGILLYGVQPDLASRRTIDVRAITRRFGTFERTFSSSSEMPSEKYS